jgi:hypothetical protein
VEGDGTAVHLRGAVVGEQKRVVPALDSDRRPAAANGHVARLKLQRLGVARRQRLDDRGKLGRQFHRGHQHNGMQTQMPPSTYAEVAGT